MRIAKVDLCCGCFSLSKGTIIIGSFTLLLYAVFFGIICALKNHDLHEGETVSNINGQTYVLKLPITTVTIVVYLSICILRLITSILLIVGTLLVRIYLIFIACFFFIKFIFT